MSKNKKRMTLPKKQVQVTIQLCFSLRKYSQTYLQYLTVRFVFFQNQIHMQSVRRGKCTKKQHVVTQTERTTANCPFPKWREKQQWSGGKGKLSVDWQYRRVTSECFHQYTINVWRHWGASHLQHWVKRQHYNSGHSMAVAKRTNNIFVHKIKSQARDKTLTISYKGKLLQNLRLSWCEHVFAWEEPKVDRRESKEGVFLRVKWRSSCCHFVSGSRGAALSDWEAFKWLFVRSD